MFVSIYQLFTSGGAKVDDKIPLSQFIQKIHKDPPDIKRVRIAGQDYSGEYTNGQKFRTIGPLEPAEIIKQLDHARKDGAVAVPYEVELKQDAIVWPLAVPGPS